LIAPFASTGTPLPGLKMSRGLAPSAHADAAGRMAALASARPDADTGALQEN
jgi:hypothetical protein